MPVNNSALTILTYVASFTVTGERVESLCLALLILCVGKALDYFVKPLIEEWRARRRRKG